MARTSSKINKYAYVPDSKLLEVSSQYLAENREQGFTLTLRSLYYYLITQGLLQNAEDGSSYSFLKDLFSRARLNNQFPIRGIVDETRDVLGDDDFEIQLSLGVAIHKARHTVLTSDRRTLFSKTMLYQPILPIVVIEKTAIQSWLHQTCLNLGVAVFPLRGYPSVPFAVELLDYIMAALTNRTGYCGFRILYLGDHDPDGFQIPQSLMATLRGLLAVDGENGMWVERERIGDPLLEALRAYNFARPGGEYRSSDMSQMLLPMDPCDIATYQFKRMGTFNDPTPRIRWERLGLSLDQIVSLNLPPFYAKKSSTRYAAYSREHGAAVEEASRQMGLDVSSVWAWEVDALGPTRTIQLVRERILGLIDREVNQRAVNELHVLQASFRRRWVEELESLKTKLNTSAVPPEVLGTLPSESLRLSDIDDETLEALSSDMLKEPT